MSALLVVETSGSRCSLAIHDSGRWFEDTRNVERLHNRVVLEMLDTLAKSAGLRRHAFGAVAFGAGPGSFTGVRMAAAVAQGVAFASDAVVVPVRSSQALALAARGRLGGTIPARVLTVTRSRRDAYYLAGYTLTETPTACLDDVLHQGEQTPAVLASGEWVGVGDRPPWWPPQRPFEDDVQVSARGVGELALAALARGEGLPPEAALPIYVSGDSPWRPMSS